MEYVSTPVMIFDGDCLVKYLEKHGNHCIRKFQYTRFKSQCLASR